MSIVKNYTLQNKAENRTLREKWKAGMQLERPLPSETKNIINKPEMEEQSCPSSLTAEEKNEIHIYFNVSFQIFLIYLKPKKSNE